MKLSTLGSACSKMIQTGGVFRQETHRWYGWTGFFEDRAHSQDGLSLLLEMADAKTVLCTTAKYRSVSP